jgi:hypothetical protein
MATIGLIDFGRESYPLVDSRKIECAVESRINVGEVCYNNGHKTCKTYHGI